MNKIANFDVLIVYSEKLANSANSLSKDVTAPFAKGSNSESCNLESYLIEDDTERTL